MRYSRLKIGRRKCVSPLAVEREWEITVVCGAGWENSVIRIISQNLICKSSAFNFFLIKFTSFAIAQVTFYFLSLL